MLGMDYPHTAHPAFTDMSYNMSQIVISQVGSKWRQIKLVYLSQVDVFNEYVAHDMHDAMEMLIRFLLLLEKM
jgi:hypothetical protein